MTRRRLFLALLFGAVVLFIAYQLHHSPEWREFSWRGLWRATREANLGLIVAALMATYAGYLLRALRWRILMVPSGHFWPVLKGNIIGFTALAILGRPGELVRPYYIARKHNMQVSPQLAVWLLERAMDMTATVLLVGLALVFNPSLRAGASALAVHAGELLAAAVVVIIAGLIAFYRYSGWVLRWFDRHFGHRPHTLRHRLGYFLHMLAEGMRALSRPLCLLQAGFYTIVMWLGIALATWWTVTAFPAAAGWFSFPQALLLLGFTLVGSLVQLPGVGGGMQATTIFALTGVFGVGINTATSSALLIWLISFYAIFPFGVGMATHEGISWRQVRGEANAEEEAEEEASC